MNSVVIKSINREVVDQAVNKLVKALRAEHPEIKRIIWFGSWVQGYPAPGSDVDLCLVITASNQPIHDRISAYLPPGFPVGIDLFVYTQSEFSELDSLSPGWKREILKGIDL